MIIILIKAHSAVVRNTLVSKHPSLLRYGSIRWIILAISVMTEFTWFNLRYERTSNLALVTYYSHLMNLMNWKLFVVLLPAPIIANTATNCFIFLFYFSFIYSESDFALFYFLVNWMKKNSLLFYVFVSLTRQNLLHDGKKFRSLQTTNINCVEAKACIRFLYRRWVEPGLSVSRYLNFQAFLR